MSKALIISADGLSEHTGGGIYLRGVVDGIKDEFDSTILVCKQCNNNKAERYNRIDVFEFKRTFFLDLIARLFFQLSFIVLYTPFIISIIKRSIPDVIYIHGTKHGFLLKCISLFTKKKIILVTDNVESALFKRLYLEEKSFRRKIKLIFELLCIRISESLSINNATVISFITSHDLNVTKEKYKFKQKSMVWPVTIYDDTGKTNYDRSSYALFTGSFKFQPNIDAVNELHSLVKSHHCRVIVAGLSASKLDDNLKDHIEVVCTPSEDEMRSLFENALFFISLVRFGSGMKTKVAEALKFGLPVIGTQHSFIGYEDILANDSICIIKDEDSFKQFLSRIDSSDKNELANKAYSTYRKYYSEIRSRQCASLSYSLI
ncbi:glycosyltransferase [Photobacterium rosenbergii]|uniref:glycosyltransferase n=1 Tax=Photobacterium rosenbergii TaxID=294936 RepID=UPI001C9952B6|nr:glycosyltransferase [Photobacterium rosenbergii]MBY5947415.1 glycosyltransferase [Photobacterium rosenbergii]